MKSRLNLVSRVLASALAFVPGLLTAQGRSIEDVRQIAQAYFEQQSPEIATRGNMAIDYIPSSSFLEGLSGQEAFYLCNLPEGGYVLVSTDISLPEILGSSLSPYRADKELPAGLRGLMQSYAALSDPASVKAPMSASTFVAPMLKTKWNQDDPFNRMCPRDGATRSMVGCVATAAAQVMKYYCWPEKKGSGKISYVTESKKISVSVDLSENTLAWDLMLDEYLPDKFSNAQANAVAKLMYTVGAACNMDYSNIESGSSLIQASQGLSQYFGYDKDMCVLFGDLVPAATWNEIIAEEINQSRPVMFSGAEASGAGHAFVLDGYETRGGNIYYHINWGWGGIGDGNYLVTNLTPSGTGIGAGQGTYNNVQLILINCQPDDGKQNPVLAQVDEITMSKTKFDSGEDILFDMEMKNVFCMLTKEFSGSLKFEFVNESGVVLREESPVDVDLPIDQGLTGTLSNFYTEALPDGVYSVRMYLKDRDGRSIQCIPNKPWPKFLVGSADAIDRIAQDAEVPNVYNLMGNRIKNASGESLPAGFYVKDGNKVLVQ